MRLGDIFPFFLPRTDAESESTNGAGDFQSAEALAMDNHVKVEKVIKKATESEKAASFLQAFNQNNLAMMELLTGVGGYKPSPDMKNDKGVTLKQWLSDKANDPNDPARMAAQNVERRMEPASLNLPGAALAQISAMQAGLSQWIMPNINSLPVLPMMQRSANHALAC